VSTSFKPSKPAAAGNNSGQGEDADLSLDSVKCRINLKFSHEMNCYITPLTLTSLERVIKSFKAYR
jgi:hypothetical protein